MTQDVNKQLILLHDLLDEQMQDVSGNTRELQQVSRLIHSMMEHQSIQNEAFMKILPEIEDYAKQGELSENLPEYITQNKQNIENWVHTINQIHL